MGVESSRSAALQDEYVLLERIAEHAGEVFRGRHVRDRRDVIVRIWRTSDEVARDRWLERCRLASRVRHPVLPAIESYGTHSGEYAYVVSEYAEGERLDHFADRVGIPPVASVVDLFRNVAVGLNAAHRNGLAHEALHPRNLLVTEQAGDPLRRLLPRVLDLTVSAFMHTGLPSLQDALFMAPEQLAAWLAPGDHPPPPADVRANIYSCGCLLHYLLTGGAPIQSRTLEELAHAHARGTVLPASRINPQIPAALDALILRALAPLPGARFASMAELSIALERVHTGSSASGVRPRVELSVAGAFRDRTETVRSPFDERPTSEAPRLPLPTPLRPPPPQAPQADVGSEPRNAPIGLFSSSPPPPEPLAVAAPPPVEPAAPQQPEPVFGAGPSLRAFEREIVRSLFAGKRVRMPAPRTLAIGAALLAALLWGWGVRSARNAMTAADAARQHAAASQVSNIAEPATQPTARVVQPPPAPPSVVPQVAPASAPIIAPAAPIDPSRAARGRWHKPVAHNPEAAAPEDSTGDTPDVLRDLDEPHALAVTPHEAPSAPEPASDAQPEGFRIVTTHDDIDKPARAPVARPAQTEVARPAVVVPLRARVSGSDFVVHGSLATSVVRRAAERLNSQLAACYAQAATTAGHNAFGAVAVEIEIDEHGRARGAQVHGAELPGLGSCVAQVAARIAADRAPDTGTVKASWKVSFSP